MATPAPAVDPVSGLRSGAGPDLDHLAVLAGLQEAFQAGIDGLDPTAPVPACGSWQVRDLVVHLADVHHWAAAQARRRPETPLGPPPPDLGRFYAARAAEVRDTLTQLGPDASSWTLLGDGPASFWRRRQTHETLVHLHDLRAAGLGSGAAVAGTAPLDVPAEVWADAVDEVVRMFAPRQVRLGRAAPLRAAVGLEASDVGWSWVLGTSDGTTPPHVPASAPAVVVRAAARDLALVLWGRLAPDEVDARITGDRGALDDALTGQIVP